MPLIYWAQVQDGSPEKGISVEGAARGTGAPVTAKSPKSLGSSLALIYDRRFMPGSEK